MADVKYIVEMDASGALKSIKEWDGVLDESKGRAGEADKAHAGLWKQFAIGTLAVDALKKGYSLFKDLVGDSIKAAIAAEDSENNLNAALETTGRNVPVLSQHFREYASALQKQTVYDDEAIMGTQALLLQLTRLDKDGIDQATRASIGLASVFKMDLESSATLVAKAMAGNVSVLSRYGITVDESLSPQEKQRELLEKLNILYGRAQAETQTFGGSLKQLNNTWDDAKEKLGDAVTKNEAVIGVIKDLTGYVENLIKTGKIEEWAGDAASAIKYLVDKIDLFADVIKRLPEGLVGLNIAVSDYFFPNRDAEKRVDDARRACIEFRDTLKVLRPSLDELRQESEKGADSFQKYKDRMWTLDTQLQNSKESVVGWIDKAAEFLGLNQKLPGPINDVGTASGKTADELKELAKQAKETADAKKKVAEAAQTIIDKYDPLGASTRALFKQQDDLKNAYQQGLIPLADYKVALDAINRELDAARTKNVDFIQNLMKANAAAKSVDYTFEDMARDLAKLDFQSDKTAKNMSKDVETFGDKARRIIGQYGSQVTAVTSAIDKLTAQSYTNRTIKMDNFNQGKLKKEQDAKAANDAIIDEQLAKDIAAINASQLTEEEKEKAIAKAKSDADVAKAASEKAYSEKVEGINAEYEMKRKELARKQAESQKATAIANAIVSGAEGAAKAWGQGGIFGAALAAIVVAATAVLISKIKSTPIPVAKGAIFKQPTFLTSPNTGQDYHVAEAGEAEIISSPRQLRNAILGKNGGRGGGRTISLTVPIYIGTQLVKKEIITIVEEAGDLGRLRIAGKAVA